MVRSIVYRWSSVVDSEVNLRWLTMGNYVFYDSNPCSRCKEENIVIPRQAEINGMCRRHWLGASEHQRRSAKFDTDFPSSKQEDKSDAMKFAEEVRASIDSLPMTLDNED